ncbi:MAG: hypothetical protein P8X46_11530 [Nitrospirales bacterium]
MHGIYDGIPVDVTEGVFYLKDSGPWGDVQIQGPVPAEKVVSVIAQLGAPSDYGILKSWKVSQGSGRLSLRFSGNPFDSQGLKFQYGEYQPQDLVIHIPAFPRSFSNGHGRIIFSPESTVLEGIQGDLGAYPLMLSGTITHQGESQFQSLNITAGFEGRDVLPALSQHKSSSGVKVTGPLKVSATLTGSTRHPKIKGWVDGKGASIAVPSSYRNMPDRRGR